MLIRKLFKFENAHVVRGCSTARCKYNIHGHSYKVEVILEAHALDRGQMVYDFGLLKLSVKELIDSFDHAITLWNGDDPEYLAAMKSHSRRWVELPVSPSAEQYARVIFLMTDLVLKATLMHNGEADVRVHSVIVHETETGYAQAFRDDLDNPRMGLLDPSQFRFSDGVRSSWQRPDLWEALVSGERLDNPCEIVE
ncbi:MAG: 6-carboxytetrahydropterin synthase [Campylobacterales bacterium]